MKKHLKKKNIILEESSLISPSPVKMVVNLKGNIFKNCLKYRQNSKNVDHFSSDKGNLNEIIAELENGLTIATTHLSFVPFVNVFQLNRLISSLKKLPGLPVIVGDLNLPANIPSKVSRFKSLISQPTYPSWKPKIQFDYIMVANKQNVQAKPISTIKPSISDHVPIGVELNF